MRDERRQVPDRGLHPAGIGEREEELPVLHAERRAQVFAAGIEGDAAGELAVGLRQRRGRRGRDVGDRRRRAHDVARADAGFDEAREEEATLRPHELRRALELGDGGERAAAELVGHAAAKPVLVHEARDRARRQVGDEVDQGGGW